MKAHFSKCEQSGAKYLLRTKCAKHCAEIGDSDEEHMVATKLCTTSACEPTKSPAKVPLIGQHAHTINTLAEKHHLSSSINMMTPLDPRASYGATLFCQRQSLTVNIPNTGTACKLVEILNPIHHINVGHLSQYFQQVSSFGDIVPANMFQSVCLLILACSPVTRQPKSFILRLSHWTNDHRIANLLATSITMCRERTFVGIFK